MDETRFQGIATMYPALAGDPGRFALQGRDPFSGDCDSILRRRMLEEESRLQGRDPFSGDCDLQELQSPPIRVGILAGTRPVFRGLRRVGRAGGARHGPHDGACRDETRFQGIATPLVSNA